VVFDLVETGFNDRTGVCRAVVLRAAFAGMSIVRVVVRAAGKKFERGDLLQLTMDRDRRPQGGE
jgi:hypothetical protein